MTFRARMERPCPAVCCWALAALVASGCGNSSDSPKKDQTIPAAPTGIAATAASGELTVTWSPNVEPDLSHYNVLVGTGPGQLAQRTEVPAGATSFPAVGLARGVTYYFAVSAEDQAGNISARSAEVQGVISPLPPEKIEVNCSIPYLANGDNWDVVWTRTGSCLSGTVVGIDTSQGYQYYGSRNTWGPGGPSGSVQLWQDLLDGSQVFHTFQFMFTPDTAVTPGSTWSSWAPEWTLAALVRATSTTTWCIRAVASAGTLTFKSARDCTAPEGGSFEVQGYLTFVDPTTFSYTCSMGIPCCR